MAPSRKTPFYTDGPLADAHGRVNDIAHNLYTTWCFYSAFERRQESEEAYQAAVAAADELKMEETATEIAFYDNILTLANTMFTEMDEHQ